MFRKKREELQQLKVEKIIGEVRQQSILLSQMIDYFKDYGNMTKRKNKRLRQVDFINCRNNILAMPLTICVSNYIISNNKGLKKKYKTLLQQVEDRLRKDIQQAKTKKQINVQLKKSYKSKLVRKES